MPVYASVSRTNVADECSVWLLTGIPRQAFPQEETPPSETTSLRASSVKIIPRAGFGLLLLIIVLMMFAARGRDGAGRYVTRRKSARDGERSHLAPPARGSVKKNVEPRYSSERAGHTELSLPHETLTNALSSDRPVFSRAVMFLFFSSTSHEGEPFFGSNLRCRERAYTTICGQRPQIVVYALPSGARGEMPRDGLPPGYLAYSTSVTSPPISSPLWPGFIRCVRI